VWRSDALCPHIQFYDFCVGVEKYLGILPASWADNFALAIKVTEQSTAFGASYGCHLATASLIFST
jgi:hypothetical protein